MKDNDYAKDDKPVEVSTLLQTIADPRATPGERLNAAAGLGAQPELSPAAMLAVKQAVAKEHSGTAPHAMLARILAAHGPSGTAAFQNKL